MRWMLTGGFLGCSLILALSATSSAATGHVEGPAVITVDGSLATQETASYEVIVDSSTLTAVDFFECTLSLSGNGVEFDYAATEAATDALEADALHAPRFLFYEDNDGLWADEYFGGGPTTLDASDSSRGGSYDPNIQRSLGIFVIKITDDVAASASGGWHTISDMGDSFLGGSDEDLNVGSFEFQVVPEPTALALLMPIALGLLLRRRNAA